MASRRSSATMTVPDFGKTSITLSNGLIMPAVGMGTYRVKTSDEIFNMVDNALNSGYRLFDTAAVYCNEIDLGNALRTLLPKYGLTRNDVFITTKLAISASAPSDHGTHAVPRAYAKSLKNLGLDYIDLYLIHFPGAARIDAKDPQNAKLRSNSWEAMVKLYENGEVGGIGVCNFTVRHLSEFRAYHHNGPIVNQVEFHPQCNQPELLQYCLRNNITVQAYASFGGKSSGAEHLMQHSLVQRIAAKHEATTAQVLLVWALQNNVAVIPKSTDPHHMSQNMKLAFRLTDAEMHQLTNIGEKKSQRFAWDPTKVR